ncbi:MAG: CARDB domain-containing protein [Marinicella sp.]
MNDEKDSCKLNKIFSKKEWVLLRVTVERRMARIFFILFVGTLNSLNVFAAQRTYNSIDSGFVENQGAGFYWSNLNGSSIDADNSIKVGDEAFPNGIFRGLTMFEYDNYFEGVSYNDIDSIQISYYVYNRSSEGYFYIVDVTPKVHPNGSSQYDTDCFSVNFQHNYRSHYWSYIESQISANGHLVGFSGTSNTWYDSGTSVINSTNSRMLTLNCRPYIALGIMADDGNPSNGYNDNNRDEVEIRGYDQSSRPVLRVNYTPTPPHAVADALSYGSNYVRLDGRVDTQGYYSTVEFQYRKLSGGTIYTAHEFNFDSTFDEAVDYDLPFNQLECGQEYQYRLFVDNGVNNSTSNWRSSFRRDDCPDLQVGSISLSDYSPDVNESFTIYAEVDNSGNVTSSPTTLRYYQSTNIFIDDNDTLLGTDNVSNIAAGSNQEHNITVSINTSGNYYIGACVDPISNELDLNDNCSLGQSITVSTPSNPDLTVDTPTLSNTSPEVGENFTITTTVRNIGNASSGSTTLRYYQSNDPTINSNDTQIGTDPVSGISSGGTSPENITLSIDSAGTYYIGACVDSVSGDPSGNNCSSGRLITVSTTVNHPDLTVDTPTLSDTSPDVNESFTISTTVRNVGSAFASATFLRYYKSEDEFIDSNDQLIEIHQISSLAPGGHSLEGVSMSLSSPGEYFIGNCVDAVTGDPEFNNCSTGTAISISNSMNCTYQLTSPNGSEQWEQGTNEYIEWSKSGNDCGSHVRLELWKNNQFYSTIHSQALNDESYNWSISSNQTLGADYKIKVIDDANANYHDSSDADFSIVEPYECEYVMISPDGGEVYYQGEQILIDWVYDGPSCSSKVIIELYNNNQFIDYLTVDPVDNDGSETWVIPSSQLISTDYQIRVVDEINQSVWGESESFFSIEPELIFYSGFGSVDTTAGLVAFFPFEGNGNDLSGNGNHAQEYGGVSYVTGIQGQAVNFDGVDDFFITPNYFDTWNNWTFSVFVYLEDFNNHYMILERERIGSYNDFDLYVQASTGLIYSESDNADDSNTVSLNPININSWNHIAVTYDGISKKIYINGILDVSEPVQNALISVVEPILIGKHANTNSPLYFKGLIDEVMVFDRALSASEISDLSNLP